MELLAISDVHVGYEVNRKGLMDVTPRRDDWLIVAGDVGETEAHLRWTWELLVPRFRQLLWCPGNHELWTHPKDPSQLRGADRYARLVEVCREYGVLTPEDPWPVWPGDGITRVAPVFLGYDYSFAPDGLAPEDAIAWAAEDGIRCVDETLLHPDPYPSRAAWCAARLDATRARLEALAPGERVALAAHWPLRRDLVRLFRIPRFVPWCGTRATEDWHQKHPIDVVVTGHLHMRATDWRAGVRFEEVSLGYPQHWNQQKGVDGYLRRILPHPVERYVDAGPEWHR